MPKIYIAHPKDSDSESVELRALGLRYNKAEPSRVSLVGLRTLEQPGYESYIHHLAGFMFANDVRERQSLHKVGFPIRIKLDQCFPILQPPLHIKAKYGDTERFEDIFQKCGAEYTKSRQRTGKDDFSIFTIANAFPAFGTLRSTGLMRSHPPSGQVSFNGYLAHLLAVRIFSSFFRTHTYPAYTSPTEEEDYTGLKRRIEEAEQPNKQQKLDTKGKDKTKEKTDEVDAMALDEKPATDKVVLRYAKPADDTIRPWGMTYGDIPNTYGIVFPFVPQLSNWDKEMVPLVMERHFLRCFGSNDATISNAFSTFVESWKSEMYSTYAGIVMSHMAKVISIALPAQSRPFPIFEGDQYRGCFLSGANYSVAIRASLTRPTTFDENRDDLRALFGQEKFLDWLKNELIEDDDDKSDFDDRKFESLKDVHNWLKMKSYILSPDQMQTARLLAANANFPQRYLAVTVDNVECSIKKALETKSPKDHPLHYEAFMSNDPFEVNLSAYGPGVPSPHIPGGKEISSFKVVPPQSTVCFRRCQLRSAVSEWKDVIENRRVRNEPRNLNARFQFVKVTGNEEKGKWYSMMEKVIELGHNLQSSDIKKGAESMSYKGNPESAVNDLFDM